MSLGFLTPDARLRVFADTGLVLTGAKLNTYIGGTPATPQATFTDSALLVPNTNPVVASPGGLFGPIYLTPGLDYKLVLTDAAGVPIWTQDHVLVPDVTATVAAAVAAAVATAVAGLTALVAHNFRLTVESGVPVSATDQLAKTTLYCTPQSGRQLTIFSAAGVPSTLTSGEFSIALPAVASQVYDVFVFSNAGVLTLELLAWTNDTTRATAISLVTTGAWCKSGDLTRRLLGSVRTTTVAGQTEDSTVKRYVANVGNRARRTLQRLEATTSWTYTTATVRQANGAVANQVEVLVSVADASVDLALVGVAVENTGNTVVSVGIGEDSLTTYVAAQALFTNAAITPDVTVNVRLVKAPAVGRHTYSWNEWSTAAGTTTWKAVNAAAGSTITPGLVGSVEA